MQWFDANSLRWEGKELQFFCVARKLLRLTGITALRSVDGDLSVIIITEENRLAYAKQGEIILYA
jgi:hypothetical protein